MKIPSTVWLIFFFTGISLYGFCLQYDVNAVLACSRHVLSRIKMCMQWISCEQNKRYDLTWELSLILDSGNKQLAASLQASWESVLPPSPIRFQEDSFQYFSHACRVPTWKDTTEVQTCMKKYCNQLRSPQRQLQVLCGHDPTWLAVMHLRWWIVNWTTPKRYCRFCKGSLLFSGKSRHGLGEISSARTLGWLENLEAKLEASKSESLKSGELSDMMRHFQAGISWWSARNDSLKKKAEQLTTW